METYETVELEIGMEVVCARRQASCGAVHDETDAEARLISVLVVFLHRRGNDRTHGVLVVGFRALGRVPQRHLFDGQVQRGVLKRLGERNVRDWL